MKKFNYKTSKDYERLYELVKKQQVVCFVKPFDDEDKNIQILCSNPPYGGDTRYLQIETLGVCYIYEKDKASFIKSCNKYNLEYVYPSYTKDNNER